MKFGLYLCLTLWCALQPMAQVQAADSRAEKDSLRHVIPALKGNARLKAYSQLINLYFYEIGGQASLDSFVAVNTAIEAEAIRQGRVDVECICKINFLSALRNLGKYRNILKFAPEFMDFALKHKQWDKYIVMSGALADAYSSLNRPNEALQTAINMRNESQKHNYREGVMRAYYTMANINLTSGEANDAIYFFKKAIDIGNENDIVMSNDDGIVINSYYGLTNALLTQKRNEEALREVAGMKRYMDNTNEQNRQALMKLWTVCAWAYLGRSAEKNSEQDLKIAKQYLNKIDSLDYFVPTLTQKKYVLRAQALLLEHKPKQALTMIERAAATPHARQGRDLLITKVLILSQLGHESEAIELEKALKRQEAAELKLDFAAVLDELQKQHEITQLAADKKRQQEYLLFAIGGCALLVALLMVWMLYSLRLRAKNRAMVRQIGDMKELLDEQTRRLLELPAPTPQYNAEGDLCPESRYDLLCLRLRDRLLKERAYLDPTLTAEGLMRELGVSRQTFAEAFKSCFGTTFPKYINMLRLKEAITLLETTDRQMENIAESVGFGSDRWFRKMFRENYNMAPGEYRRMKKKGGSLKDYE